MGKYKDKIRKYFHVKKDSGGKKKVMCPYCEWTSTLNATRMKKHVENVCKKIPLNVKTEILGQVPKKQKLVQQQLAPRKRSRPATAYSTPSDTNDESEEECPSTVTTVPIYTASTSTRAFCDQMNDKDQNELSTLMARAMYVTATPFHRFEHPYWKTFFSALRPSFKIPSGRVFSSSLLSAEYDAVKLKVEAKISSSESLALGTDGWTNGKRRSIANVLLFTPEPIFLKSIECGAVSHTGPYYFQVLDTILQERGPENFFGVCTDNAANMRLGGKMIEEKYRHISSYGCSMHGLHLTIQDICTQVPIMRNTIKDCHEITVEILNKPSLFELFNEKQTEILKNKKVSLKLSCETRFGSQFRCMECVQGNQGVLRSLCIDPRMTVKTGREVRSLINEEKKTAILSDEFWRKVESAIEVLKPIVEWLFYIQSDTTFISEVPMCFKDIEQRVTSALQSSNYFSDADENTIINIINARKEFCLQPIHLAAALLDPSINDNEYLSAADKSTAIKFIDGLAEILPGVNAAKVSEDLLDFLSKSGSFSGPHLWRKINRAAHMWWKAFCSQTELAKIALKITPLPASSAAIERTFNTQGLIHSKKRNRLLHGKTEKLVYLYENYRTLDGNRSVKSLRRKAPPKVIPTADDDNDEERGANFEERDADVEEIVAESHGNSSNDDIEEMLENSEESSESEEPYYIQPYVPDD